jgi:hypothetical protein
MKTNLKKTTFAALIAGIFFISAAANAAPVVKPHASMLPDTGKMSKMSDNKMHDKMGSKMSKKKKMDKMDKMSGGKM